MHSRLHNQIQFVRGGTSQNLNCTKLTFIFLHREFPPRRCLKWLVFGDAKQRDEFLSDARRRRRKWVPIRLSSLTASKAWLKHSFTCLIFSEPLIMRSRFASSATRRKTAAAQGDSSSRYSRDDTRRGGAHFQKYVAIQIQNCLFVYHRYQLSIVMMDRLSKYPTQNLFPL